MSKSLHTYTETNHHPRANKFQRKTYHANSPATQEHTLERQQTTTQSHTKHIDPSQNSLLDIIALQREEIQFHRPEHRRKLPEPGNLDKPIGNPTHWVKPPQYKGTTNHQNTESPLQTQKSRQDEKAEKYQQVNEREKCPPSQTKEEEIGNLPEKEFRIRIIKMIQNLENKMELQISWRQRLRRCKK